MDASPSHDDPPVGIPHTSTTPHAPDGQTARAGVPRREALAALAQRHSVGPRWLTDPAPDDADLRRAIACALRAPDHGLLRPWRAVLVGREQRRLLGDLFASIARDQGGDEAAIAREIERAERGPALVAWIARIQPGIDDVPAHEQWMTTGGALTLFLSALHLMGYGAKTLSGRKCSHPRLQAAFCTPGETLVAFITVGTPSRAAAARGCDDLDFHWQPWQPQNLGGAGPSAPH